MLDRDEFKRWREAADNARRAAEVQANAGLPQWACFLAEQAAQLAMKGLLHGLGVGAWGHDLVRLGTLTTEAFSKALPQMVEAALRRLSRHYIPARYPDAHPAGPPGSHYGAEDAAQALADMAGVIGFVDETWERLTRATGDADG